MVQDAQTVGLRSRWLPIAAYSIVGAATQLVWLNFAGVTTVAADRYGVSETAIGWLAQVFPLLYVVLAIPAGLLLDRWFRPALLAGACLTALGAVLRLGDTYTWLLAGQLVVSIAQPLVLNAVTGITGRYLAVKDRSTGIAAGTASIFAGMMIAFALSAIFASGNQLPTVLTISAVLSTTAALALLAALRLPADHKPPSHRPDRNALRIAWSDPLIRRLCVLALFPFGVFIALTTFAQPLLEPAGVTPTTASTILLLNVIAGVAGSATIPILVSRHHAQSLQLALSLTTTAVACAALALIPSPLVAYLAITTIGLLLLPALPVVLDLVAHRTGEAEGTAAALIWLSGNLGGLLVATAVGLLVPHPTAAFLLLTATALAAVPGTRPLRHPPPLNPLQSTRTRRRGAIGSAPLL